MPAIGAVAPGKYPVGATDRPIVTCMFLLVATAKTGGGNNIPVMPSYNSYSSVKCGFQPYAHNVRNVRKENVCVKSYATQRNASYARPEFPSAQETEPCSILAFPTQALTNGTTAIRHVV